MTIYFCEGNYLILIILFQHTQQIPLHILVDFAEAGEGAAAFFVVLFSCCRIWIGSFIGDVLSFSLPFFMPRRQWIGDFVSDTCYKGSRTTSKVMSKLSCGPLQRGACGSREMQESGQPIGYGMRGIVSSHLFR